LLLLFVWPYRHFGQLVAISSIGYQVIFIVIVIIVAGCYYIESIMAAYCYCYHYAILRGLVIGDICAHQAIGDYAIGYLPFSLVTPLRIAYHAARRPPTAGLARMPPLPLPITPLVTTPSVIITTGFTGYRALLFHCLLSSPVVITSLSLFHRYCHCQRHIMHPVFTVYRLSSSLSAIVIVCCFVTPSLYHLLLFAIMLFVTVYPPSH
jgi:hypothetical protein